MEQRHPNLSSQEGRKRTHWAGDDSSSQWGVEQSLKEPAPSRFTDHSILIPNLHIYEH